MESARSLYRNTSVGNPLSTHRRFMKRLLGWCILLNRKRNQIFFVVENLSKSFIDLNFPTLPSSDSSQFQNFLNRVSERNFVVLLDELKNIPVLAAPKTFIAPHPIIQPIHFE